MREAVLDHAVNQKVAVDLMLWYETFLQREESEVDRLIQVPEEHLPHFRALAGCREASVAHDLTKLRDGRHHFGAQAQSRSTTTQSIARKEWIDPMRAAPQHELQNVLSLRPRNGPRS